MEEQNSNVDSKRPDNVTDTGWTGKESPRCRSLLEDKSLRSAWMIKIFLTARVLSIYFASVNDSPSPLVLPLRNTAALVKV
jgi:hypothetical protein